MSVSVQIVATEARAGDTVFMRTLKLESLFSPEITRLWQSQSGATGAEIVLVVPTFRRPDHLLQTLRSLQDQRSDKSFQVIVIENDADKRDGAAVAVPLFEAGYLQGQMIVAHEKGNCSAYNAGIHTALQSYPQLQWLLVIDDDEIADRNWLDRMIAQATRSGAHIVGGPQMPLFSHPGTNRLETHPVFQPPYKESGEVARLYSSGNLLLARQVLERIAPPWFDPQFNFLGGGDSDLFERCAALGLKFAWCHEARVYETVPDRRLEADWIRARSLRNGVISTLVEKRRRSAQPLGNLRTFAKSAALLGASPFRASLDLIRTGSLNLASYRVYVALGRVLAHFGYQNEQYRQPEKN